MQKIYDTRERSKVELQLREPGKVGIYGCGVTVYDLCHVGHARTLIAYDVIVRHLRQRGLEVRLVRNITDVDDKIIRRGHAEGKTAAEVARFYADAMAADLAALGVAEPDVEPRATAHIQDMIDVIRRLEERGLAYAAEGDVYYSVAGFPSYGALSGQSTDALQSGARIEVGEHKRSPLDFTLWKGAKPGEPAWESPWGPGRPGWHIECSAMSHRYLGDSFDIHGGGSDLIFPHHENEIAQSEGAFGSFARHWMHSGMVNFGGEKMSKSLGNVVTIRKVAETHDLEALRLLLISVHYRSPANFTIARDAAGAAVYPDLDEAEARLDYFYRTLERLDAFLAPLGHITDKLPPSELATNVGAAMDDDFNTAAAIGHLYEAFVLANKLLDDAKSMPKPQRQQTLAAIARDARTIGETLGIMRRPPSEFLLARRGRLCVRRGIDPAAVEAKIAERTAARAGKDFKRADEIRAELKATGVELMDGATGTAWRVA
jgi:cysteinyl-tRNA synthetase